MHDWTDTTDSPKDRRRINLGSPLRRRESIDRRGQWGRRAAINSRLRGAELKNTDVMTDEGRRTVAIDLIEELHRRRFKLTSIMITGVNQQLLNESQEAYETQLQQILELMGVDS